MHVLYRICTKNKNTEATLEACADTLQCFSIFTGLGAWKGQQEDSLCLETVLEDTKHNDALINTLAQCIKHNNQQEAVLVTKTVLASAEFI